VRETTDPKTVTVIDTTETELLGTVAVEEAQRETGTVSNHETEIVTGIEIVTAIVAAAVTVVIVTEIIKTGKGAGMTAEDKRMTAGAAEEGIGHGVQLPLQMSSVKSEEKRHEIGGGNIALLLHVKAALTSNGAERRNGMTEQAAMKTILQPMCRSG